ncbi:MAG: hypothetical protein GY804_14675 [Alphaproteobacteria bacterium]|nr:hypothetical protein [Alphaproteobacteria bacterium]
MPYKSKNPKIYGAGLTVALAALALIALANPALAQEETKHESPAVKLCYHTETGLEFQPSMEGIAPVEDGADVVASGDPEDFSKAADDTNIPKENIVTVAANGFYYIGDRLSACGNSPYVGVHPDNSLVEVPVGKGKECRVFFAPDGKPYEVVLGYSDGGNSDNSEIKFDYDEIENALSGVDSDFSEEIDGLTAAVRSSYPSGKNAANVFVASDSKEYPVTEKIATARDALLAKTAQLYARLQNNR